MRRLFLSLIITLGAFAAPNLWAQTYPGSVKNGGKALSELNVDSLKLILSSVCGATGSGESWTLSRTNPNRGSKKVYFVAVNDYWIGSRYKGDANSNNWSSIYKQINEGVQNVTTVDQQQSQTTSSGTFYTHQANNVDKFFFIESNTSIGNSKSAFGWYNEWSYVEDGTGDYSTLSECKSKLDDGAPFPAPHACANSLENNH